MGNIGGVSVHGRGSGITGEAYGHQGQAWLKQETLAGLEAILKIIQDQKILDECHASDIGIIEEGNFKAAIFIVENQPFLLMRPIESLERPTPSFVFDPVAKTFLGGIDDVFTAMHDKANRETEFIRKMFDRLEENEGLSAKYAVANSVSLIAGSVKVRQQVANEFLTLKIAAEKIHLHVMPCVSQKLVEFCSLMSPVTETKHQEAKTGFLGWFHRVFQ